MLIGSPTLAQPNAPIINPFTGQPIPQTPPPPAEPEKAASKPAPVEAPATPTPPVRPAEPGPAGNAAPQKTEAPASTTTPPPAQGSLASTPNPGITLKFDNADIYDVLSVILGDVLKLDYTIDPSVQGKITLKSTGDVSLADVLSTLEAALATNNISIVRQGRIYKVTRDANAARDATLAPGNGPASTVMQIIPLRFVQASQLVNTLRNFVGPQAAITNDPTNRHLIIVDRAANIEKIVEMVKSLDADYFSHIQIRLVPLKFSEASEVAKELDGLFKTSGILNWTGTDATKSFFLPVTRMNAVLVATSNGKLMESAEQWIKNLDVEPKDGLGAYVHIYPVANSNAVHLSNLLQQIFGGNASGSTTSTSAQSLPSATSSSFGTSSSSTTSAGLGSTNTSTANNTAANAATRTIERGNVPASGQSAAMAGKGLAGSVQVFPDEITNTLVVKASAQDFQQIKRVLERLDTAPRQVLVQVMVAEVTLNDTLQYGVEWWLKSALSSGGKSWSGYAGLDGSIAPSITTASTGATPTVTGNSSGFNYAVFGSAGQVIGMLNLLGQDTDVNVLSTPHVLATDGKIARIEVGNEVPVITQTVSSPTTGLTTTSSFTTSNSVQYRPTGILLEVKPSITSTGRISLAISQEVSSVGSPQSAGGSQYPSFQKRKVTTDATIEDGRTIMLAGLIEDRGNDTSTGIPGLKSLPVLGGLFGTTKKVRNKTELLITITPYMVNSREDSERLAGSFQDSLQKLQKVLQPNAVPDLSKGPAAQPKLPANKPQTYQPMVVTPN